MRIIIHDLLDDVWKKLALEVDEKDVVVSKDNITSIGSKLGKCRQLILISRCVYGGFSPFVQNVLEELRTDFEPFLKLRHGQTHYEIKKKNKSNFSMICCFYGDDIKPSEEKNARILSVSDGISLQAKGVKILFYDNIEEISQINTGLI